MSEPLTAYARAITTPLGRDREISFAVVVNWLWPPRSSVPYNPELGKKADDALCLSISGKMEGE